MRYRTVTEEIFEQGIARGKFIASLILQKGFAEGIAEAMTISFKEGETKGKRDTARELLKLGLLTDKQIASATDQTVETIKALKREIKKLKS